MITTKVKRGQSGLSRAFDEMMMETLPIYGWCKLQDKKRKNIRI